MSFTLQRGYSLETFLRAIVLVTLVITIIFLTIPNVIKTFSYSNPLISITLKNANKTGIPVLNAFVCGEFVANITVEYIPRPEKARMIDTKYVTKGDTSMLKAGGDWTNPWPCFIFTADPEKHIFQPNKNDQISINVLASKNVTVNTALVGAIFGLWNSERSYESIEPFVTRFATVNTYTFTVTELVELSGKKHSYFTVNKQNTMQMVEFGDPILIMKFNYSPDQYNILSYKEKKPYRIYDLIGAIGGFLTPATALWIFLFGRGKYKSWGFTQRFLFQSSPNAKNISLPFVSAGNSENISHDSQSPKLSFRNSPKTPHSGNQHLKTPRTSSFYFNHNTNDNNNESSLSSNYTNPLLTPTQPFHGSVSTPNPNSPLIMYTNSELKKLFNKILDEKLWSLEQTLSRHYLAGFRLRKYNDDLEEGTVPDPISELEPDSFENNSTRRKMETKGGPLIGDVPQDKKRRQKNKTGSESFYEKPEEGQEEEEEEENE